VLPTIQVGAFTLELQMKVEITPNMLLDCTHVMMTPLAKIYGHSKTLSSAIRAPLTCPTYLHSMNEGGIPAN
jgi:hypothetical protein